MMPSVLFDARMVLQKPTGIGQYIASLVPELILQAPDWHFHLLHQPTPWPEYGLATLCASNLVHHVSTLPHMSLRQQFDIPRLAKRLKVDLIHYPHFDAPVLWNQTPTVATIHDAKYLKHPEFFPNLGALKRRYMRFCFSTTLQRTAAVIAVSKHTAQDLTHMFHQPAGRIDVIYEAAHTLFTPASRPAIEAFRNQYALNRPFILSVGERRPHKNYVGLIHAYAQSQSRQSHDLVIIGQAYGDYTEPEMLVNQLGLEHNVHLLSNVDHAQLVAAYGTAELFMLVSFYEGFGLPLLEAMQCGVPVITSRTSSAGEVAGDAGVLVDPTDQAEITSAMDALLLNPEQRSLKIRQGYRRSADFSWHRAASETLGIYKRIVT